MLVVGVTALASVVDPVELADCDWLEPVEEETEFVDSVDEADCEVETEAVPDVEPVWVVPL